MAYYATFLGEIVSLLRERGVSAELEYPNRPLSKHAAERYLTIALESAEYEPALPYCGGRAFPVTLQLRLRLHQAPETDVQALSALYESLILPAFSDAGYDLQRMKLYTPEYDRNLGKMVMRAACILHGYVAQTPSQTECENA